MSHSVAYPMGFTGFIKNDSARATVLKPRSTDDTVD
jgi:hypothetical protein